MVVSRLKFALFALRVEYLEYILILHYLRLPCALQHTLLSTAMLEGNEVL